MEPRKRRQDEEPRPQEQEEPIDERAEDLAPEDERVEGDDDDTLGRPVQLGR